MQQSSLNFSFLASLYNQQVFLAHKQTSLVHHAGVQEAVLFPLNVEVPFLPFYWLEIVAESAWGWIWWNANYFRLIQWRRHQCVSPLILRLETLISGIGYRVITVANQSFLFLSIWRQFSQRKQLCSQDHTSVPHHAQEGWQRPLSLGLLIWLLQT